MIKSVIICDRCGQQYENKSTFKGDKYVPHIIYTYKETPADENRNREEYDLCPYCGHDLSEWLHNRKQKFMLQKEIGK